MSKSQARGVFWTTAQNNLHLPHPKLELLMEDIVEWTGCRETTAVSPMIPSRFPHGGDKIPKSRRLRLDTLFRAL